MQNAQIYDKLLYQIFVRCFIVKINRRGLTIFNYNHKIL
jgi:hypothetical protein